MTVTVLRDGTYDRKPWKNGGGITEDVWLYPEGASQDNFDIRLSLAEISKDGPFSSFPGIDRTITLVGGDPFVLEFAAGQSQRMYHLVPFAFSGELTPVSRLDGAPSRDFNVMTRRGSWSHEIRVAGAGGESGLNVPARGMVIVHVVSGTWQARAGRHTAGANPRDTVIVQGETSLLVESPPAGEAILAILQPDT